MKIIHIQSIKRTGAAALIAALIVGFAGNTSASAALPEFVVTGGKTTFKGANKAGVKDVLETVGGVKVECNKDKSRGEISSGKAGAITKTFVTFEECSGSGGTACGNVTAKNIETTELEGTPIYATSLQSTVLVQLNAVGTRFAAFECQGLFGVKSTLNVRGKLNSGKEGLLGLVPTADLNKSLSRSVLIFRQTGGVQEFALGGVNLETEAMGAFGPEESGLQNEEEIAYPVSVELKA